MDIGPPCGRDAVTGVIGLCILVVAIVGGISDDIEIRLDCRWPEPSSVPASRSLEHVSQAQQPFRGPWSLTVSQGVVATGQDDETLCDILICCTDREPRGCDCPHVSSYALLW
jgi:hypothetical protein